MCGCPSPCWQLAICVAQSAPACAARAVPSPHPKAAGTQLRLYLGNLWFKRSLRDKNGIFIQTLLSLPLCSEDGEREKMLFFLPFSLRPRRAQQPCAAARQAAQQGTKLLSVVLLPAIRVPAVAQAAPEPAPWVCSALGQGGLGQGCSPRTVRPDWPCLCSLSQAAASSPCHGPGRPRQAPPKQTTPGKQACKSF